MESVRPEKQVFLAETINGGFEGASRAAAELATWFTPIQSADVDINDDKPVLDARSRDMARNDGFTAGGVTIRQDSIVGGQYTLNAQPDFKTLGADETWQEEFQEVVESKFTLWAESPNHWPDAARLNTLTGLVRLAVGLDVVGGEVLATVEWLRDTTRPFATAIQMIDLDRLSNPFDQADTKTLRRGVERNRYGAPIAYHIRAAHPADSFAYGDAYTWDRVEVRKPWGRLQVIHLYEQTRPDQSRGLGAMVSVLKEMRMTKKFRDVVLQNAVLNATYAAVIESELPSEAVWEQLGVGSDTTFIQSYLNQLAAYVGAAKGLRIDGVKIPHLYPGTKLNFQAAGTPGGIGTGFEEALLRHIAAALGLSYEQFSRDYTKTNYSSARASMNETWKFMQARKKLIADRFASAIYGLWLEEAIAKNEVPLPAGKDRNHFYEGLHREAYGKCEWIGASRGQIDELKETQAAALRLGTNLSTYEEELARTGKDFRVVFAQLAREKRLLESLGLTFATPSPDAAANANNEQEAAA